jgi:hypothetical protein
MPLVPQIALCMTTFLTFGVYTITISNSIPVQSEYLPAINVYFILSSQFTLWSLVWFIAESLMRTTGYMPLFLKLYVDFWRWCIHSLRSVIDQLAKSRRKKPVSILVTNQPVPVESKSEQDASNFEIKTDSVEAQVIIYQTYNFRFI